MSALLLDILPTREIILMEQMEGQMITVMTRDEITHHLFITTVAIILRILRQDTPKSTVDDTILRTLSLPLLQYVLQ
jgi:hypothetical protein